MKEMTLQKIDYHPNGFSGIGFHVIRFRWRDGNTNRVMVATVFPEPRAIAVIDIDLTHEENIEFANGNSWRGDHFEPQCRAWIKQYGDITSTQ